MKKATVGFLAGTGSAVIMGLSWYATKRISQISGAFIIDVLATRYLISGGVLLLLWVFGKIRLHFEKKDIVPLLGLSLLMPVLYNILEYTAISYISTAEIGMLCSLSTVVASLMGYLILKEPVGKAEAAFMVLAVSGVIFTNVFDFDVHDSSNIGRLLMLGCVLASSLNRILSRKLSSYKTVTEITAIMMWSAAVAFSGIAFGRHLLEGSMNEYVDFIRERIWIPHLSFNRVLLAWLLVEQCCNCQFGDDTIIGADHNFNNCCSCQWGDSVARTA